MAQGDTLSVADASPVATRPRSGLFLGLAAAVGLAAAYLLSGFLTTDASAFLGGADGVRLLRFNLVLIALIGFETTALGVDRRRSARDFAAVSALLDAGEDERAAWRARLRGPSAGLRMVTALGGAAFGLGLFFEGVVFGEPPDTAWSGHVGWMLLLNPLQFACLATLVLSTLRQARLFSEVGWHVRAPLLDRDSLRPFGRIGLRFAAYWLVGSSVASLLVLNAGRTFVIVSIVAATVSLGFWALLAPSLGIHRRLRESKRHELTWLRREIGEARQALADNRTEIAARLPALLAYESRIEQVSVWPFDVPTLVRFGLFVLLGLGSWLGGALVERAVDSALR